MEEMGQGEEEAGIGRLRLDPLSHVFSRNTSVKDLARASEVCTTWREGVKRSFAMKKRLSFSGWKMDDDSIARIVSLAYSLKELDISRNSLGCEITDDGLRKISSAKCIGNLRKIDLCGMTGITDKGVVWLVSKARALRHLNIGDTFITNESLFAIANSCPNLEAIVLLKCRCVTARGLICLVKKCLKLKSINALKMKVSKARFSKLLEMRPALYIIR